MINTLTTFVAFVTHIYRPLTLAYLQYYCWEDLGKNFKDYDVSAIGLQRTEQSQV